MIHPRVCNNSNMMGATDGAETEFYTSGMLEFTPGIYWATWSSIFSFLYSDLYTLCLFSFWPSHCLSLLWFMASYDLVGIVKFFFKIFNILHKWTYFKPYSGIETRKFIQGTVCSKLLATYSTCKESHFLKHFPHWVEDSC